MKAIFSYPFSVKAITPKISATEFTIDIKKILKKVSPTSKMNEIKIKLSIIIEVKNFIHAKADSSVMNSNIIC